jgi:hypothetical protein
MLERRQSRKAELMDINDEPRACQNSTTDDVVSVYQQYRRLMMLKIRKPTTREATKAKRETIMFQT